ncbi:MAG: DNA recombination protein RmuC [Oscillospiraceae bacterium]|nr:DNA recombination protein RmuC [Oscillospiraceae bacterium]MBR0452207.1 DNA recombination protein RmuC [Oscillospiraceae bacterium]
MTITDVLLILSTAFSAVSLVLCCFLLTHNSDKLLERRLQEIRKELTSEMRDSRKESSQNVQAMSSSIGHSLESSFAREDSRLMSLENGVNDRLLAMDKRLAASALQNERRLEYMRETMENRLNAIQNDNNQQLSEIRSTVDEKLQKTLEEKLGRSFKLVSDQLEAVYKSMGEMQNLATGVGDLKKVLSNVKTRGIFGEIQLGAILEQILSPEQYDRNVVTKPGSSDPVEFAVKFPGGDDGTVYLPIDSKFPLDVYQYVLNAYDSGEKEEIDRASRELYSRIRQEAKKIRDKYVQVPFTTDFAILFLPVEGLYAEAVRIGVVDEIQRLYKVSVAGPTTMAALLNSFQMGFRTLAIQKRSSEVWKVLGDVRTEFDTFGAVLQNAQNRIVKANEELDKLIGVRTRQIQRKLKDVSELSQDNPAGITEGGNK